MAHPFAGTLEQAFGIAQVCAIEKSDIDVRFENIHVGEGQIPKARDGTAVMHEFLNLVATLPHAGKPTARNCAQLRRSFIQPDIDGGIVPNRFRKLKQLVQLQFVSL